MYCRVYTGYRHREPEIDWLDEPPERYHYVLVDTVSQDQAQKALAGYEPLAELKIKCWLHGNWLQKAEKDVHDLEKLCESNGHVHSIERVAAA